MAGRPALHQLLHAAAPDCGDRELLERYVGRGEQAAFAALLERHGPLVLGLCRRLLRDAHLAEDVFQATFLVLARKAHSIRQRDSVASWLHGVAARLARRARLSEFAFASRQARGARKERAASDPALLQRLSADPLETAKAEGLDLSASHIKALLGMPDASDQEIVSVLRSRVSHAATHCAGCGPLG